VISRDIKATVEGIERAIEEYGSIAHLATALGVDLEQLRRWRAGDEVMPVKTYEKLIAVVARSKKRD